jgi:diguanylate cyclase (GGDEF)-like protein
VGLSIGAFLLIALLGCIDYLTGSEIAFSVFYLFPVGLAAWYVDGRVAFLYSVTSTVIWYFADALTRTQPYSHPSIPIWNAATRLVMFLSVTGLLAALRNALDRESKSARIDYLTEAMNGRAFYEAVSVELSRLARYGRPFALMYLDVDNLKTVNDRYGHAVGDEVLKVSVDTIRRRLRPGDAVARLGGDEFAVLLPETDEGAARAVAERMQSTLRDSVNKKWPVSFSIGVLTCVASSTSVDELIEAVDGLMYQAKASGKDGLRYGETVVAAQQLPDRQASSTRSRGSPGSIPERT